MILRISVSYVPYIFIMTTWVIHIISHAIIWKNLHIQDSVSYLVKYVFRSCVTAVQLIVVFVLFFHMMPITRALVLLATGLAKYLWMTKSRICVRRNSECPQALYKMSQETKYKLKKTVRRTSCQKPRVQSVSVFFKLIFRSCLNFVFALSYSCLLQLYAVIYMLGDSSQLVWILMNFVTWLFNKEAVFNSFLLFLVFGQIPRWYCY